MLTRGGTPENIATPFKDVSMSQLPCEDTSLCWGCYGSPKSIMIQCVVSQYHPISHCGGKWL